MNTKIEKYAIWTTLCGTTRPIKDISNNHLLNIKNYLENKLHQTTKSLFDCAEASEDFGFTADLEEGMKLEKHLENWLESINKELEKRKVKKCL